MVKKEDDSLFQSREPSDKCISISFDFRWSNDGKIEAKREKRKFLGWEGARVSGKRAKAISNGPSGGKRSRANSDLEKLKL